MIKGRFLTFDFYRARMIDETKSFEDMLKRVIALPLPDRTKEVRGVPITLQEHQNHGAAYEGNLLRIRMDGLPVKADLAGNIEDFGFNEDEGVGEETAFRYDPKFEVLAIQRNRIGVTATAFVRYMNQFKTGSDGIFNLVTMIEASEEEKLERISSVRDFEIELEGIPDLKGSLGKSSDEILELMAAAAAPKVSLRFAMSYQKGSLETNWVKKVARSFAEIPAEVGDPAVGATRLQISGKDPLDEQLIVDLLEHRVTETVRLETEERRISYESRRKALREAWDRRSESFKHLS